MVLTTMKPAEQAHTVSLTWPTENAFWENLGTVLTEGDTIRSFFNSTLITVPTIALALITGALASWVIARGRRVSIQMVYYLLLAGVMLPPAMIASVRLLQSIGLYNTVPGLILFQVGVGLGGVVFLMTGFVRGLPYEIEEAARIDGASSIRVFFSIILPSMQPVLLTVGITMMLAVWNEFFTVFFLLPNPSFATLPLGLYKFAAANEYQLNWNLIFMQILLVSLPMLIVYLFAQRRIISGLLSGAGK
ncbi:MAG: carbohydrate ABC transporter permease [Humibacter sp.]